MIQGFKGVKYGLTVPASKKKAAPVAKPGILAAFGDDDSDGEHEAVPQQLARQAASKKSNNKVRTRSTCYHNTARLNACIGRMTCIDPERQCGAFTKAQERVVHATLPVTAGSGAARGRASRGRLGVRLRRRVRLHAGKCSKPGIMKPAVQTQDALRERLAHISGALPHIRYTVAEAVLEIRSGPSVC